MRLKSMFKIPYIYIYIYIYEVKVQFTLEQATKQIYSSTLPLTSALDVGG